MNESNDDASISRLFADLKAGKQDAANELWAIYFDRLVKLARQRLSDVPKRASDEEDVALSVFNSLCVGAERGRFAEHVRRDDLWHLLLHLTKQKTVDYIRHQTRLKRGGGEVRGESVFLDAATSSAIGGLDQIVADEPGPEMLAVMEEQHRRLLEMLPNGTLRQIAIGRMQGETNEEIAVRLKLSVRSV